MKEERVQKFIALSGIASRRKAEELIEQGRVKVNGKKITLGDKCYPDDNIEVDNKKVNFDIDDKIYIILNKKKGYVTTKSDELGRRNVFDLLSKEDNKPNLFSVGRLDKETTGLLILTNDGDLAQKIIHPSSKVFKEYITITDKKIDEKDRKILEKGVVIDGIKLRECKIKDIGNNRYLVKIGEGKKRQIRKMFEIIGHNVLELKRTKIGNLDLKNYNLKPGQYIKISRKEIEDKVFK